VRSAEDELRFAVACVPGARELLQPGQWPEFPRPVSHVEHMLIVPFEQIAAYGPLVTYV
jgi:hypothetical protein